jgi:RHS repeat-associated protein
METEKDYFYSYPLAANPPGYLDGRIQNYFSMNAQQGLLGRLSYNLSYVSGQPNQLCAYSYNADGFLACEAHQFNPSSIGNSGQDIVKVIAYPSYNLRGSPLRLDVLNLDNGGQPPPHFTQFYQYDGWNRLSSVSANGFSQLASYQFDDALGLLKQANYYDQPLSNCTTADNTDVLTYSYDVRDRLIQFNSHFYDENLYYDGNASPAPAAYPVQSDVSYNGNINGVKHVYHAALSTNDPGTFNGATYYGYKYDGMNRLVNADASVMDPLLASGNPSPNPVMAYGDEALSYDKVGNILSLSRGTYYQNPLGAANNVDNWYYKYKTGSNQLTDIDLFQLNVPGQPKFGGVYTPIYNYTYDASGNLRSDSKTKSGSMSYCRQNQLQGFTVRAGSSNENIITSSFDANDDRIYNDNLVQSTVPFQPADPTYTDKHFYLRDINGKELGVFDIMNGNWEWNVYGYGSYKIASLQSNSASVSVPPSYYIYDHLGGVRVTYGVSGLSCIGNPSNPPSYTLNYLADYYAFGKILRSYVPSVLDRRGFDGLEREKRISDNNYYTHFRELDAEIGRWWSIDPRFKSDESPFVSFGNNPIHNIDPRGDAHVGVDDKMNADDKKALSGYMSTKSGLAFVGQYASAGQTVMGHKFTKSGKYDKKGVDLNFASKKLGATTGGETTVSSTGGRLQIQVNLNTSINSVSALHLRNEEGATPTQFNEKVAYYSILTVAHELMLHAQNLTWDWTGDKSKMPTGQNHHSEADARWSWNVNEDSKGRLAFPANAVPVMTEARDQLSIKNYGGKAIWNTLGEGL